MKRIGFISVGLLGTCVLLGAVIDMTLEDFHVAGTQVGDVTTDVIWDSSNCTMCHTSGGGEPTKPAPWSTWNGSLMAHAGRDPLFFAQMTTAEQDVGGVGYYCMRCHVPLSIPSGHAYITDGSALDSYDRDGVNCHFCHSMVDPFYKPGISPPEDADILAALVDVPDFVGNAMFVLDPEGRRRGTRADGKALHQVLQSPFHASSEMCGTCHDVGNVAVSRMPNGTYSYNAIDQRAPSADPWMQFPLERTYTEWKLSQFASTGVETGGRFGGDLTVVSSCQDCHMPTTQGKGCIIGPTRTDLRRHDFAGAAVSVLSMVAELHKNDPSVDLVSIQDAKTRSISMLQRAATLQVSQEGGSVRVRVINESGHKIPTGHIEGRRMWVTVRLLNDTGATLHEYGGYHAEKAELDAASTEVYEMLVGLSPAAAALTGYSAGPTGHMSLADTIVKDNRIPPRGFSNAAFEAGGAPVVAHQYADGQHWDDSWFALRHGTSQVAVELYYQNVPKEYVEHLRDGNHTDNTGQLLWELWNATDRGAPVLMAGMLAPVQPFLLVDLNSDQRVDGQDLSLLLEAWGSSDSPADLIPPRGVDGADLGMLLGQWSAW